MRVPDPSTANARERMLAAAVLAAVASSALPAQGQAPQFAELSMQHLPADFDHDAAVVTGDVDADGDHDLVVGDYRHQTRLYLNDGSGRFTDETATRMPIGDDWTMGLALGDVDGDGDLDLVVGNHGWQNRLLLNDGSGHFTDATAAQMPIDGDLTQAVVLGDVDGDRDLDLLVGNGVTVYWQQNRLYLNDGSGRFTDATAAGLPIGDDGTTALALGDVDGDGDLDLVIGNIGYYYYGAQTRLCLNDGAGRFTDVTAAQMPVDDDLTSAVALGDVDGDGDLDLVVGNGYYLRFGQQSRLYLNDGTGRFSDATAARMPVDRDDTTCLVIGDVDGDGDPDLVVGNQDAPDRLYLNDGTGRFTDATVTQMPVDRCSTRSLALDDVDGDGDADLVLGTFWQQNRLYLNDGAGGFTDATVPRMPVDRVSARSLALGDLEGDGDLDLVVGHGYRPDGQQVSLHLNDGAGWFTDATAAGMPAARDVGLAVALGDVDGDGDLDLAVGSSAPGSPPAGAQNRLYLNDGSGRFSDATAAQMPVDRDATTSLALGDVDGDGDLDLVVGNEAQQNRLYLNDGSGHFTDATIAGMPVDGDRTTSLALGDVDGDGDQDLVVGNKHLPSGQQNRLYLNDGSGRFTDATAAAMPVDRDATTSLALGDVDGDADLDLAIGNHAHQDRLYLNDGSGRFTDATASRMPVDSEGTRSLVLGDVDGDGDLDLAAGNDGQNRLYLNDGSGLFTDETAARMPASIGATSLALADVDADGDPDLLDGAAGPSRLYLNLLRQLDAPYLLRLGDSWQLDVYARFGPPRLVDAAFPYVSFAPASIPLPPLGTVGIDPALIVPLPSFVVPQPAGVGSVSLQVPNAPSLVGIPIYTQALLIQHPLQARLTGVVAASILAR